VKKLVWPIIVLTSILGWSALMAQSDSPKLTAEFPGASLKWVHVAETEFQREKLDLNKYTVSVAEEDDTVTVGLASLDSAQGRRGNSGSYPGFVVIISKKDLHVIRSNYIR
jgi:hypothetical protein